MRDRWLILAILTFARTLMGFQFQSVTASASPIMADFNFSYAELGTLIGLYLLPGAAIALPSGMLAQRFGDKRIVCLGTAAMAIGAVLMSVSGSALLLGAGRLLSGTGAVLLNVLVTKMVIDWFQGREVVTALGVLVASWPIGIAIAMVVLPPLAAFAGWQSTMIPTAPLSAVAFALIALVYRAPSTKKAASARLRIDLTRSELALALLSGGVWALYNMSFILVLTFGPAWLMAYGESAQRANGLVSLVSWTVTGAVPLGAWFAERLHRPLSTMLGCFLISALAICALPAAVGSVPLLIAIGLIFGPAAGLIMALPGQALPPQRRAVGMGLYFTCYYVGMGVAPGLAGLARDARGSASAPLYLAAALLVGAAVLLIAFRGVRARAISTV
jgi:MFS family permease